MPSHHNTFILFDPTYQNVVTMQAYKTANGRKYNTSYDKGISLETRADGRIYLVHENGTTAETGFENLHLRKNPFPFQIINIRNSCN